MKTIQKISATIKNPSKYAWIYKPERKYFLRKLKETTAEIACMGIMGIEVFEVDRNDLDFKQETIPVMFEEGDEIVSQHSLMIADTGRNPHPHKIEQVKWNGVDISYGFYDGDCWSVIPQRNAISAKKELA